MRRLPERAVSEERCSALRLPAVGMNWERERLKKP